MITRKKLQEAQKETENYFNKAGIVLSEKEKNNIEVIDFGFGKLDTMGVEIVVYVNTDNVCAKELVLFPGQTCAEHIHPSINNIPGKEETFRCRYGKVFLYVSGSLTENIKAVVPKDRSKYFTVFHEIILNPGEQYTLYPDTLHWFQAGGEGAIVSEFSTTNTDELDQFTDPDIDRFTKISD